MFDPGIFLTLLPGVKAEDGVIERAEEKRETLRFNKAADHLRRRIRESGGRDRDAEHLLAELQFGDGSDWRPSHGPERY